MGDGFIRDSTADSTFKRKSVKRKAGQLGVHVSSFSVGIAQTERVVKCPRLSLLLDRVKSKAVSTWAEGGAPDQASRLVRAFSRVDAYGIGRHD